MTSKSSSGLFPREILGQKHRSLGLFLFQPLRVRIVIAGAEGVGKSCIIKRYFVQIVWRRVSISYTLVFRQVLWEAVCGQILANNRWVPSNHKYKYKHTDPQYTNSNRIKPVFTNFYSSWFPMLVKFWYLLHPGIDYGATRIFVDKREVRFYFMSSWRTFKSQFLNPLLEAGELGNQLDKIVYWPIDLTGFCAHLRYQRPWSLQRSQEWILQVCAETVEEK